MSNTTLIDDYDGERRYEQETRDYEDSASVQEAARRSFSSLIMDDNGGKPEGLVTERDIVTKVCINDTVASSITNKQIMLEPLIAVDSTCTSAAAADMMLQYNVRHLHVVGNINKNRNDTSGWNNPLGIITPLDFARFEELSNDEVGEDKVEMMSEYYL